MARILIAWELGGGAGHCVNLLSVIQGLLAKGHRVYAAVRDLHTTRQVFGGLEVSYLQAPFLRARPANYIRQARTFADVLHNTGFAEQMQLEILVDAWRNIYEFINPHVVICEHAP